METALVCVIVAVAAIYMGRRILSSFKKSGCDCGCGCGKNCPTKIHEIK